jgi:hypothetical protein
MRASLLVVADSNNTDPMAGLVGFDQIYIDLPAILVGQHRKRI